jgi:hypothetical protein
MAKLTKAQARKRLEEAASKINMVQSYALEGKLNGLSMTDVKKLFPMMVELRKIADRIK